MSDRYSLGQIVFSKSGRDKGRPFIVLGIEDEYVYLSDGKLRLVEAPKCKKKKHAQLTNVTVQWIKDKRIQGEELTNRDVQKAINDYLNKTS